MGTSKTMEQVAKELYLGRNAHGDRVWVTVDLREHDGKLRLSIQGETAAKGRKRDGPGSSGGQIIMEAGALPRDPKSRRIAEIWQRWHLNDMRAGCEHQRGWTKERIGQPCPVDGYKYGSAWLFEELPTDIIAEIKSW